MEIIESKEEIGRRLEITRLALGYLKQNKFCEALEDEEDVSPARWNNYESGRDRLTINLALTICRKFPQVTLDWLFRGAKGTLLPAFTAEINAAEKLVKRLRR